MIKHTKINSTEEILDIIQSSEDNKSTGEFFSYKGEDMNNDVKILICIVSNGDCYCNKFNRYKPEAESVFDRQSDAVNFISSIISNYSKVYYQNTGAC